MEWRKRREMVRLSLGFLTWETELMAGGATNRAWEFQKSPCGWGWRKQR